MNLGYPAHALLRASLIYTSRRDDASKQDHLSYAIFSFTRLRSYQRRSHRRSHQLRYVLRNKTTEETYLVVLITLYHKDFINDDGSLKEGAQESLSHQREIPFDEETNGYDEAEALKEAREKFGPKFGEDGYEKTSPDDVD